MSRKSGRSRSIRSCRSRPSRASQTSGPNQPTASGQHEQQRRAAGDRQHEHDAAEHGGDRGLQPDEALDVDARGPAGEVEPARDPLTLAAADRGRHARAEPCRQPADEPRHERPAPGRDAAGAPREPLERPAVEHHRHPHQADDDAQRGERAGQQRRHTSTRVVRRIRTKATAQSVPAKTSVASPTTRRRHLAHHARRHQVHGQQRGHADPDHEVGREDGAREQRADLADQVLARLERLAELVQRADRVAAGALLDHERRHQHAELARGQPAAHRVERVVDGLADPQLLDHRLQLRRGRVLELTRGELDRGRQGEAGRGAVGQQPRDLRQLGDEQVAPLLAPPLDPQPGAARAERQREDERHERGQEQRPGEVEQDRRAGAAEQELDRAGRDRRAREPGRQPAARRVRRARTSSDASVRRRRCSSSPRPPREASSERRAAPLT